MLKETRNHFFYKDEFDCALNSEIESNFSEMMDKLLASPEFKEYSLHDDEELQDLIIRDGIYPGYCKQKYKVLFIGRDSHGLRKYDYSWTTWENLKKKRRGGYKQLDRSIMSIGRVLSQGIAVEQIDNTVRCIYRYVTHENGYENFSFALINVSKIDHHEDKNFRFNKEDAQLFCKAVGYELMKKQVEIINPDLVISLNLSGCDLNPCTIYDCSYVKSYRTFRLYKMNLKDREINFVDSKKHFSRFTVDYTCSFLKDVIEMLNREGWEFVNSV